jgi:hypothetical protein
VYGANWHVPIDDTHHWKFMFMIRPDAPLPQEMLAPTIYDGQGDNYHNERNVRNRYL